MIRRELLALAYRPLQLAELAGSAQAAFIAEAPDEPGPSTTSAAFAIGSRWPHDASPPW